MKLLLKDFDFYYLIICSRGPGSETITVDKVPTTAFKSIKFDRTAKKELKTFGACGASADFNDEGPIIAVPKGTMPFKGIFQWIKYDNDRIAKMNGEMIGRMNKELKGMKGKEKEMMGELFKSILDSRDAVYSAQCRVFLQTPICDTNNNRWTSANGWRKLKIEILSERQFKILLDIFGLEGLGKWNCEVIKKSIELYQEGKLPKKDFNGC